MSDEEQAQHSLVQQLKDQFDEAYKKAMQEWEEEKAQKDKKEEHVVYELRTATVDDEGKLISVLWRFARIGVPWAGEWYLDGDLAGVRMVQVDRNPVNMHRAIFKAVEGSRIAV